ncbi:DUF72 domain-containing protein, partial [Mucilaginibacter sp.]|uniref:DUF72 domain-containing protein n=1 Tax=Mucilaginibacter sp. TaxID=1882438 RepID=UPI002613E11A
VLPVPNKAAYPPEFQDKSRLCYYASLFNSIEINSSFYKIPQATTIRKWRESVPDHFRFTFKLWKGITHEKELLFNPEDITRFMDAIGEAGEKKGSLLIQFPPSIRAGQFPQISRLLEAVREADDSWNIAVELRHSSLYQEQTDQLLTSLNMTMVIHDLPASAAPPEPLDLDFIYLRFHGPNGGYRGSYADDFLAEYAQNINQWLAEGKRVYTYFNNTMGAAVHNLATINQLIQDL